MNPSYIFLPLLALLLAGILLLIYYRMALRFALQAIDPQRMNYGAVLRQEMERNQLDPDRMDVKYDKLFLVNQRGQELTARLYLTPSQTDRYILFLHGYNYPWIGVLKYLPMLLRLGFNVLVPDLQAQGESQGSYITFGALESDDALEWLEEIQRHAQSLGFDRARIGVMGESMGAVTALLTMEKANSQSVPLEEKPLFCVADCPFSDWDSMMRLQGKKRYSFDPSPLLPLVKRIIRQKSGAQMDTVNAVKAASAIRVPVLLFHGTADKLVPFGMSQQIADACPTASLCLVEGAKHMNCCVHSPKEYRRQLVAMLKTVRFEPESAEEYAVYL